LGRGSNLLADFGEAQKRSVMGRGRDGATVTAGTDLRIYRGETSVLDLDLPRKRTSLELLVAFNLKELKREEPCVSAERRETRAWAFQSEGKRYLREANRSPPAVASAPLLRTVGKEPKFVYRVIVKSLTGNGRAGGVRGRYLKE